MDRRCEWGLGNPFSALISGSNGWISVFSVRDADKGVWGGEWILARTKGVSESFSAIQFRKRNLGGTIGNVGWNSRAPPRVCKRFKWC